MASQQGAVASGADYDQAVRRRNVPSTTANGGMVDRVEIDEKKTQVKKVRQNLYKCYGHVLALSQRWAVANSATI